MAGIYLHVPFCKSRCHYCDFFKSTKLEYRVQYLENLSSEIVDRKDFFLEKNTKIETIYFGGGTPSLFSLDQLFHLIKLLYSRYSVSDNAEITIEVNPDDLNREYLEGLKTIGVNRLSIGIQSFRDEDLKMMGRRHNARQSFQVLEQVFDEGFQNVGIDLIYGLPWSTAEDWLENIEIVKDYPLKHISAYHLTIEPGTKFGKEKLAKKLLEIEESESEKLFWQIHDRFKQLGFEHYEISNFCKDGFYSRHNTSYWNEIPYLGLGPGAHSFDGDKRYWNKPDLHQYISKGYQPGYSYEILSAQDRFNEKLMLGLRTGRGICKEEMKVRFNEYFKDVEKQVNMWINREFLKFENGHIRATRKGWFVIDGIIEDLFIV
ncbi:radical SAM family heme chaperone HemW [Marinilabilia rubra]|uniref:Heme chaperone HemW n=1 Tax=Marinilabilia rubra TaxID=2162893 RepID=A0A2U2B9Q3_9BACT|nr:radical SAM family heme chaperone HemW [Marinilabilia rubra]PWD99766.1 coproporphyrinogen III oxidase [Marinilabilia rubra]